MTAATDIRWSHVTMGVYNCSVPAKDLEGVTIYPDNPRRPTKWSVLTCRPDDGGRMYHSHSFEADSDDAALVGGPQQIAEKVHRYHEELGHEVLHLDADGAGLTRAQHRVTLELFQSEIAPILLREIPSRPFPVSGSSV